MEGYSSQFPSLALCYGSLVKKVANKPCQCCQIFICSFAVKDGARKSGRILIENLFEGSNRDGS